MGREIRKVPPNWQHPLKENPKNDRDYQPLLDQDFDSAMILWWEELQKWLNGEFARVLKEYKNNPEMLEGLDQNRPILSFARWHGEPPDPKYYRPKWEPEEATWLQVYQTVSEGTPVTPHFATPTELVNYLVKKGDFWDQRRGSGGWDRKSAEAFVRQGFAPSLIVKRSSTGVEFQEPRDTK